MANKISGLGRGLGSLIPPKVDRPTAVSSSGTAVALAGRPENRVVFVPVAEIVANPEQPRLVFRHHELEDLTNSIREHGIIQPLVVSQKPGGGYELIAGERRLRAARILSLPTVPVIVRSVSARDKLLLALIENIQREDLNPLEEAKAYSKLVSEFNLTQEGVSQKVGKARSTVANTLRLLELPDEIQQAVAAGTISAGSARAILGLKDDKSRLAFFRKLIGEAATTRQVEAGVRHAGTKKRKDPALLAVEEQIRNKLGTRVEIKKRGGKGSVVISFFSEEEYQALVKQLQR
jgi:ParB family transcriptional regulator, chromosome partitioning protein